MAEKKKAGAFDIRIVIATLVGIYGVVLTVLGIVEKQAEIDKAAGININLWGGIGMLAFTAVFVLWARLRPLAVPVDAKSADSKPADSKPADSQPADE